MDFLPPTLKICGLSTAETLDAAIGAGADAVGFVHFPKSPRHVPLDALPALAAHVGGRARIVLLTVDADDALLDALVAAARPDVLQLHGRETPERAGAVRARLGLPAMKAVGVGDRSDLDGARAYRGVVDALLFDAKPPRDAALPGGNGVVFDWSLLGGDPAGMPFLLSGGLTPTNVAEAVAAVRPAGVDVSSGVESAPGLKDPARIRAFAEAALAALEATRAPRS